MARDGGPGMERERADIRAALAVALLWTAAILLWQWGRMPADLNAVWFAGHFLGEGRPDLVYVVDPPAFPATTDPDWLALGARLGCGEPCVYPFVYPPLWAALAVPVAQAMPPDAFSNLVLLVQLPLFALSPLLAWRLWRPAMGRARFTAGCLVLATLCTPGTTGIVNNQPQLLVTVLMLAAFERAAAGRPGLGGAALALAAALKLYPALLALLWLREGNWRALGSAALAGAMLLAASLALGGLELHRLFLAQLAEFSGRLLPASTSYALPALMPWLDPAGRAAAEAGAPPWHFALAARSGPVLLLLGLALLVHRWRRGDALWRARALLPALVTLVSMAAPVAWAYYFFITVFALLVLPDLWGRAGSVLAVLLGATILVPLHILLDIRDLYGTAAGPVAGAVFALGSFLALALAPYRPPASTS